MLLLLALVFSMPHLVRHGNKAPYQVCEAVSLVQPAFASRFAKSEIEASQRASISRSSDKLQKRFNDAGGILYQRSVLSPEEFNAIRSELFRGRDALRFKLYDETTNSVARNRMGAVLPPSFETVRILSDPKGSLATLVNCVMKCSGGRTNYHTNESVLNSQNDVVLSTDVPVELRVYEKTGSCMDWHVDDVLFDEPQIEVVLTMENTSDCTTQWETQQGMGREAVETTPNSALLIKAGGVRHKVSHLKSGRRVILKCVFVRRGSKMVHGAAQHINQFGGRRKIAKKGFGGRKKKRP